MSATASAASLPEHKTMWQITWTRFKRHKLAVVCSVLLILMILATVIVPVYMASAHQFTYESQNLERVNESPSAEHPLGTDRFGRDYLTRLAYAGRISLAIGILSALLTTGFGVLYGALSSYVGGKIDSFLMRCVDIMLSIPSLPLLMIMAAVDPAKIGLENAMIHHANLVNMARIVFIIVLFGWMTPARLIRGEILSLKTRDFIEAARAQGASHMRIIFKHLIPNSMAPIIVSCTLAMGNAILIESALSFLGLGVKLPTPTWGNLLMDAQRDFKDYPALAIYPGVMISLAVMCFNFMGDGLRDALDPKQVIGKK